MATVAAFHTIKREYPPIHRDVYHDESECHYGKAIKMDDRVPGEAARPAATSAPRSGASPPTLEKRLP
jgi:hypothetical protein